VPFLEESLELPLKSILPAMQDRMVQRTTYFGVRALKNPLDMWVYQELVHALRPDVVIEVGNHSGGTTLALAHLCDLLGHGRVIGLDVTHEHVADITRRHPRITLIEGDASASFPRVRSSIDPDEHVLIIEDSSHTYENTLNVLRTYSPLIKPGGYFIVEDGICHHGLDVGPEPGPYEAIETFTAENPHFIVDRGREDFVLTWNPRGFLRRV
jgi:cephalosporin hydroxylase